MYLVQKSFQVTRIASFLFFMLLAASCSSDSRYKRQVIGDESYLDIMPLAELHVPTDLILPIQNSYYDIPVTNSSCGAVGKSLDIRSPMQPLALVSGSQAKLTSDTAILLVKNSRYSTLWPQVVNVILAKKYTLDKRDDASQTLYTGWIEWNRQDEDQQYRGRYQISVKSEGDQHTITVKPLNLEQGGKSVMDIASLQRYSTSLLNIISIGLNNIIYF